MTIGPDVLTSIVDHEQLTHLLFATDFSEGSLHALPYALSLAEESNAEITLLHVLEQLEPMPLEYSKELLSDYRKRLWNLIPDDASLWCKPNVAVESGLAADSIVRKANEGHVELIVMGASSRRDGQSSSVDGVALGRAACALSGAYRARRENRGDLTLPSRSKGRTPGPATHPVIFPTNDKSFPALLTCIPHCCI